MMAAVGLASRSAFSRHFRYKGVMNALKRSVPIPKVEITMHCAARRQVFGKSPPLTAGGKNIHHAIRRLPASQLFVCRPRASLAGSKARRAPTLHRSGRSDSEACCGRISCGFRSSTSAPPRIGSAPGNHNRFIQFKMSSDRHLGLTKSNSCRPDQGTLLGRHF